MHYLLLACIVVYAWDWVQRQEWIIPSIMAFVLFSLFVM